MIRQLLFAKCYHNTSLWSGMDTCVKVRSYKKRSPFVFLDFCVVCVYNGPPWAETCRDRNLDALDVVLNRTAHDKMYRNKARTKEQQRSASASTHTDKSFCLPLMTKTNCDQTVVLSGWLRSTLYSNLFLYVLPRTGRTYRYMVEMRKSSPRSSDVSKFRRMPVNIQ